MNNHNLFESTQLKPFLKFGLTHNFWSINKDTLIGTIGVLTIVIIICIISKIVYPTNNMIKKTIFFGIESLKDLLKESLKNSPLNHLCFVGTLFIFIMISNCIAIIPWFEEPTKDINSTISLALISFIYIQFYSISHNGIINYIKEFFKPFFLMLPLNLIGTFSTIISLSFRLFGNIFGSFVIISLYNNLIRSSIYLQIFNTFSGANVFLNLFFGLFEGLIQAFIFASLTVTYLSLEIAND